MTKELAEFLKEASENAGNECEIYETYSGRGMFGRTTCGVVVDSVGQLLSDVLGYVSECIGEDDEGNPVHWDGGKFPDEVGEFRTDNMAMQTIVY